MGGFFFWGDGGSFGRLVVWGFFVLILLFGVGVFFGGGRFGFLNTVPQGFLE